MPSAERRTWEHKPAPRTWADDQLELAALLERHGDVGHLFYCGPDQALTVREWSQGDPPEGWEVLAVYAGDAPTVTFRRADGKRLRVSTGEQWTGAPAPAAVASAAWSWLRGEVEERWRGGTLLASPGVTGRDLIARSLPRDASYPCPPPDVAELIRSTSGQHRAAIELAGAEVGGMVELDLRLAYLALVRGVPWGRPEVIEGAPESYNPHQRARYEVSWRVPRGWCHVGLLGGPLEGDGWSWPRRPGERGRGWVDGRELALARRHGWEVTVHRSIMWPCAGAEPMRAWAANVVAILEALPRSPIGEPERVVARAMLRAIVLHAIGQLHGAPRTVTRSVPIDQAHTMPADAIGQVVGERMVWREESPPVWPELIHPEWTASIWAAGRVRLLTHPSEQGALFLEPAEVVGFRGDAIYSTRDPRWPDSGKPGQWRVKAALGPFVVPASLSALDDLRRAARG